MNWPGPLEKGVLLRRYQRFLADVRLDNGQQITAHCPNTGAMTGCAEPGSRVWLTRSDNPRRKYPFTWQVVERDGRRICIHSALANAVVAEALDEGMISPLAAYSSYQREVKLASGSRVDFALRGEAAQPDCYMEVKSVTLDLGGGRGAFPDAVSVRARRHIEELMALRQQGFAAALCFAVLHTGIEQVSPARHIDPVYADLLVEAERQGVQLLAYRVGINEREMRLREPIPVLL